MLLKKRSCRSIISVIKLLFHGVVMPTEIVVIGEKNSGKTQLINRLCHDRYSDAYPDKSLGLLYQYDEITSKNGNNFHDIPINRDKENNIYEYKKGERAALTAANVIIFCVDSCQTISASTLAEIEELKEKYKHAVFIIAETKCDKENNLTPSSVNQIVNKTTTIKVSAKNNNLTMLTQCIQTSLNKIKDYKKKPADKYHHNHFSGYYKTTIIQPHLPSSLSVDQIKDILQAKLNLKVESTGGGFVFNRARKQIKINALDDLLDLAKNMSVKEAVEKVKKRHPDALKGIFSKRTEELFDRLKDASPDNTLSEDSNFTLTRL